ncbi:D-alanyl-D-alanine carboxypeptidase/D-alanyl-D-alanine-endopeptidase [Spongiactinospora sp. TRM90649]|uniref:D-alanyl-D-alanine carboxypeptidase/D-alanyl-D-alanine endopeptidase n=1 Tax=Spongiactinospora sp. TRM90649 TaxID=3031114 RepID=UPI0023F8D7B2|nr:D-alanyl-D-alanine carboxypeptidase/D-alanyl-D-alanine-endopeptidase [Spongiactinospora sp. TRM90649]MDF5754561.1 D-alanyl-D-alanine carboxypeptidase/D-alanyl-D-alanine-endopeptidase [Spongiactinospora sp. TRM90649]
MTATVAPAGAAALTRDIDRILRDPRLSASRAGVVVRSAATGEILYERDADRLFTPASLVKLVTAAAALDILGPGHRFTTRVLASGHHAHGVLHGDLHLLGTGDPAMLAADYGALAAKVAATGVRTVTGGLVADDTWFDDERHGAGWLIDDESLYFAAPISALTASPNSRYDAGAVIVTVTPAGRHGDPAEVTTTPRTGHLAIDNRATTGATTRLRIRRAHGSDRVVVTGTVDRPAAERIAVRDPTGYAATLFGEALAEHGVTVEGHTAHAGTPAGARELAAHESMPLAELMAPLLKWSSNAQAEILTKTLGRAVRGEGTWRAGLEVLTGYGSRHGVRSGRLRDGSGLSRLDSMTPREVAALLLAVRAKPWFATLRDALPAAGHGGPLDRGTLRRRMDGTPAAGNLRAKTGTMTEVSGLAGYVDTADGEPLVFCVLLNNHLTSVKDVEDAVAVRLSRFRRGPGERQLDSEWPGN